MAWRKAVVLLIVLTDGCGEAAASDRPPAQIAALCAACHRLDLKPNGIPPLFSLSSEQIVAMMRDYKTRPNANHIMRSISRSLSDGEIATSAAYLSSLDPPGRP